jgi:hypothetical protein
MRPLFILLLLSLFSHRCFASSAESLAIFENKLNQFSKHSSLVAIAKSFLHTPYQAHTLEINQQESLVVNLTALDCTTYIENVLALNHVKQAPQSRFRDFKAHLQKVRYRGGKIDGYPSRLHYFSEWLSDNESKGLIINLSQQLGGIALNKQIDFMSTHIKAYQHLNESNVEEVQRVESVLSSQRHYYLPLEKIPAAEKHIQSGDVIAITTAIKGLDITHTGFALRQNNGLLHLLHASTKQGVVVSKLPLVDYLKQNSNNTGIMVARVL